jgi:hypothetical protein
MSIYNIVVARAIRKTTAIAVVFLIAEMESELLFENSLSN